MPSQGEQFKYLTILFMNEERESGTQDRQLDWGSVHSDVDAVWSQALGSDQKDEVTNKRGRNQFPLKSGWTLP